MRYLVNPVLPDGAPAEVRDGDDAGVTVVEWALAQRAVQQARDHACTHPPLRPGEIGVACYPRLVPKDDASAAQLLEKLLALNLHRAQAE